MIADDTTAIREAMRKLSMAKAHAKAEAARKAAADAKPADLPAQRPLFSESCPPFRGFFLADDGEICPSAIAQRDSNFDQDAWDEWDRDDWDDVTLDSGVTEKTLPLFMWGHL